MIKSEIRFRVRNYHGHHLSKEMTYDAALEEAKKSAKWFKDHELPDWFAIDAVSTSEIYDSRKQNV